MPQRRGVPVQIYLEPVINEILNEEVRSSLNESVSGYIRKLIIQDLYNKKRIPEMVLLDAFKG